MESKVYRALGLMSGTSLDGVDAALIETDGERIMEFGPSLTIPYAADERSLLDEATQAALKWNFDGPAPNVFARAEDVLDRAHARTVRALSGDADIVGYHGQTVLHRPDLRRTLQLGTGLRIADDLGCPVVYDFRSADVAAGGQGAPLAPIFHKALVQHAGLSGITAILNLGGVGNVTIVDGDRLLASDTGPANGPLDSWLEGVDDGGSVSRSGRPDLRLVDEWLERDFFTRDWPKSADRHDFDVLNELHGKSREDGAATLAAFTALSVKHTLAKMDVRPKRVIVCGGGRHNRTVMTLLSIELGCPVLPAERLGWDSDAVEAQAFSYLAVRVLRGLPNSFPTTTGVPEPTVGGRVAYPSSKGNSRGGE